jgi:salicylate hydroxylase
MSDQPYLIAGGGIAGLAAALGLSARGTGVRLFEQAKAFEEVGAGLQMSPNGVRALRELGAWDAIEPSCVIPSEIHVRDGMTGALLQRIRLGKPFEQRFGAPYRVCHRADLLAGLVTAARHRRAIELNTARKVVSAANTGTGAAFAFADGGSAEGQAAIVADGIRSTLRAAVSDGSAPVSRNTIIYRALVPLSKVPPEIEPDCVTLWLCRGGHVVHYAVSSWRNFNIVAACDGDITESGWNTPANFTEVARRFPGICADLADLLAAPANWLRWPGADLGPIPRWSNGRIVLAGDAAHATLPFLAQGAVMSLEDAVILAREVGRAGQGIETAFAAYEAQRKPRTTRIQEQSRKMCRIYHANGALAFFRNLTLNFSSPSMALNRVDWIYRWMPGEAG